MVVNYMRLDECRVTIDFTFSTVIVTLMKVIAESFFWVRSILSPLSFLITKCSLASKRSWAGLRNFYKTELFFWQKCISLILQDVFCRNVFLWLWNGLNLFTPFIPDHKMLISQQLFLVTGISFTKTKSNDIASDVSKIHNS